MKETNNIQEINEEINELEKNKSLFNTHQKSKFEDALREWLQQFTFDFNDWAFENLNWQDPTANLTSEAWEFANKCLQREYLTARQEEAILELYSKVYTLEGLKQIIIEGKPEDKISFFRYTNERILSDESDDDDKYYKKLCFG
jgi:hypothetical protein